MKLTMLIIAVVALSAWIQADTLMLKEASVEMSTNWGAEIGHGR